MAASELAESRLQSQTNNRRARVNMALYCVVIGDRDAAEAHYSHLVNMAYPKAIISTALEDLDEYLRIQPENALARYFQGKLEAQLDEFKQG